MTAETRVCQNCRNSFVIEPDDFAFYERMQVPPPTWCPECRLMRKMARRNESTLHKAKCALCGREIMSLYPSDTPFAVYCNSCWWSDKWEARKYGRAYDFPKPFFEQFHELTLEVPRPALYQKNVVDSPYSNHTEGIKNCYLMFDGQGCENVMYGRTVVNLKDTLDSHLSFDSELCYGLLVSERCHRGEYLFFSENCVDSAFLFDCKNCSDCFLSSNLRSKKYVFRNEQLSQEDYERRLADIDLGSFRHLEGIKKTFLDEIVPKALRKYLIASKTTGSTGDYLFECKNVRDSFVIYQSENSRYCVANLGLKDCYDAFESGFNCELQYECHACNRSPRVRFSSISYDNHDLEYSEVCHDSTNLFGCIGLRNKQYCILNKQYTKEEYEVLIPKIIEHINSAPYVDQKGRTYRYGEFFPPELSPFAYNETLAQEYFPLSKSEAEAKGYCWREPDTKQYAITKKPEDLPDHIKDVTDDILKETIGCAHAVPPAGGCNHQCTTAFKVIPEELAFYRRMNLPLPRLCPNCRHYERLVQRNPLKLWHRQCQCAGAKSENGVYTNTVSHPHHGDGHCPNEFETSYAPERKEIVYCENCYQSEVV